MTLFWVCLYCFLTMRNNLATPHGFICPLFNYSRHQPWGYSALVWVVALTCADAEMLL